LIKDNITKKRKRVSFSTLIQKKIQNYHNELITYDTKSILSTKTHCSQSNLFSKFFDYISPKENTNKVRSFLVKLIKKIYLEFKSSRDMKNKLQVKTSNIKIIKLNGQARQSTTNKEHK